MSAVDLSGTIALVAVGVLTANLLLGLLLANGYNPTRQWPHTRSSCSRSTTGRGMPRSGPSCCTRACCSSPREPRFRLLDVLVPIWSPVQPLSNTLGAIGFYLVLIVVVTSLKRSRTTLGRHRWKAIHYTNYAAAAVFFVHGVIADPLLKGRPVDLDRRGKGVRGGVRRDRAGGYRVADPPPARGASRGTSVISNTCGHSFPVTNSRSPAAS